MPSSLPTSSTPAAAKSTPKPPPQPYLFGIIPTAREFTLGECGRNFLFGASVGGITGCTVRDEGWGARSRSDEVLRSSLTAF